jgi:hypothetical protein
MKISYLPLVSLLMLVFSCAKKSIQVGEIIIDGTAYQIHLHGVDSGGYYRYSKIEMKCTDKSKPTIFIENFNAQKPFDLNAETADLNFDGYLDIYIPLEYPYADFEPYHAWLYVPENNSFIYTDFFETSGPFSLNQDTQELIIVRSRGMDEMETGYKCINYQFEKVWFMESTLQPSGITKRSFYQNKSGQMSKVYEKDFIGDFELNKSGLLTRSEDIKTYLSLFDYNLNLEEVAHEYGHHDFLKHQSTCEHLYFTLNQQVRPNSMLVNFYPLISIDDPYISCYSIQQISYSRNGLSFTAIGHYVGTIDYPNNQADASNFLKIGANFNEPKLRWEFFMVGDYDIKTYCLMPSDMEKLEVRSLDCSQLYERHDFESDTVLHD